MGIFAEVNKENRYFCHKIKDSVGVNYTMDFFTPTHE